jgi:thioesterase domain-containing protein/NAD(P)-dependent dehydrogenase (short-subunit alcohol dehydrogenase family)/acyl carrier protein
VPRLTRVAANGSAGSAGLGQGGTVLITGGTGGLGSALARHLVANHGVRSLLLTSRHGPGAAGAGELERELTLAGAEVRVAACDVADRAQVSALLDCIPDERPLRAVVHVAGVADHSLIDAMNLDQLDRVLAPKLDGAINLHELTGALQLGSFVLFSSMAATFGGAGLGNYAAANAFLDALAAHRRSQGLPATSIAWGLWSEVGMGTGVGDQEQLLRHLSGSASFGTLSTAEALGLFDRSLDARAPVVMPVRLDDRVLRAEARAGSLAPLVSELAPVTSGRARAVHAGSLGQRVAGMREDERAELVRDEIRAQIAAALGYESAATLDMELTFVDLGFDSLVAEELRNKLNEMAGLSLPSNVVFDYPTPTALIDHLLEQLDDALDAGAPESADASTAADAPGTPGAGNGDAGGSALVALFRQAHDAGQLDDGMAMLEAAARLRPRFDSKRDPTETPRLVTLAAGAASPGLLCFSSVVATASPHEYVRFAHGFARDRAVDVIPICGYRDGEPLPATLEAATQTHAEAILQSAGDAPFALVGYSTGGWLAYAVAAQLVHHGLSPAGVVLIDTYSKESISRFLLPVFEGMLRRGGDRSTITDAGLTAMSTYLRLLAEWRPSEIDTPTLLVRASARMDGVPSHSDWKASWEFRHSAVDVPGDHLTLMEEHSSSTAAAVEQWLAEL